jgi:hypothetical protein
MLRLSRWALPPPCPLSEGRKLKGPGHIRGRQNIALSGRELETCPLLPWATRVAGTKRQADEGKGESNMPVGPVIVDHDVVPRGLVRMMVTTSSALKPIPQTAGWPTSPGPVRRVIGRPGQKLIRAEPIGGTGGMGGAGQRSSGRGAARAGGHGPHPTPIREGRAGQGRSAADEPGPGCELGEAVAAEGAVFAPAEALVARAPFWATGLAFRSDRDAVVAHAVRAMATSRSAGRIDLLRPSPPRVSE